MYFTYTWTTIGSPEINNYFSEWEKIGKIYPTGDYYELFSHSDCLITDCISFLAEYLPTGKPVIHLRKENQYKELSNKYEKIVNKLASLRLIVFIIMLLSFILKYYYYEVLFNFIFIISLITFINTFFYYLL